MSDFTIVPAPPGYFVVSVFLDIGPDGIAYRMETHPVIAWRVQGTGAVPVVPGSLPVIYGLRFPDGKTVVAGVTFESEAKEKIIDALVEQWKAAKAMKKDKSKTV